LGQKAPYVQDARLRERLGRELQIETVPAKELVIEGGAMEMDGKRTFLATRSVLKWSWIIGRCLALLSKTVWSVPPVCILGRTIRLLRISAY